MEHAFCDVFERFVVLFCSCMPLSPCVCYLPIFFWVCSWFKCLFWGGLVCVDALFLLCLFGFWNYRLAWKKKMFQGFWGIDCPCKCKELFSYLGDLTWLLVLFSSIYQSLWLVVRLFDSVFGWRKQQCGWLGFKFQFYYVSVETFSVFFYKLFILRDYIGLIGPCWCFVPFVPVLQLVIGVFMAFILCHYIGLVAAIVLGFARVLVLFRLVVYGLVVSFALLGSSLSTLFFFLQFVAVWSVKKYEFSSEIVQPF